MRCTRRFDMAHQIENMTSLFRVDLLQAQIVYNAEVHPQPYELAALEFGITHCLLLLILSLPEFALKIFHHLRGDVPAYLLDVRESKPVLKLFSEIIGVIFMIIH